MLVMLSSIWQDTLKVYLRFIASATPGACIHLKVYYLPSVRYKVIEILAGGSCSLVEWKLETGRTHQILHDTTLRKWFMVQFDVSLLCESDSLGN